ncbi:MAG TPA: hypothetical protein VNM90_31035, partial [Haliangium sp.]|nr:hypothetical protein [Haliangium sp.]
ARTWSVRDLARWRDRGPWRARADADGDALHVHRLDELYAPAGRAGLRVARAHLWRSVRVPPYALRIPTWLPGRWWSHCTVVFVRPAAQGSERRP